MVKLALAVAGYRSSGLVTSAVYEPSGRTDVCIEKIPSTTFVEPVYEGTVAPVAVTDTFTEPDLQESDGVRPEIVGVFTRVNPDVPVSESDGARRTTNARRGARVVLFPAASVRLTPTVHQPSSSAIFAEYVYRLANVPYTYFVTVSSDELSGVKVASMPAFSSGISPNIRSPLTVRP
jgi:hypothetical protein